VVDLVVAIFFDKLYVPYEKSVKKLPVRTRNRWKIFENSKELYNDTG
jgi:hypothetical protein